MSKNSNTLNIGRPTNKLNKNITLASLIKGVGTKRVNFDLPVVEHTKLKIYAAKYGKTIKELLTAYVASLPD